MEKEKLKSKWSVMIIMILSTFMSTLDGSIVNVALPVMSRSLKVTTSQIQFVSTCYLIVIAGTVLIFGNLGDMIGKTKMFLLGLFLFTVGSFLCGLSQSFTFLIFARVIQAVGAAGTMANSQGIVTEAFPSNERGKALGLVGTAVALGSLVGPGLGGLIVGATSWEYIFLINVPIGIIVFLAGLKILPKSKVAKEKKTLDITGAALFLVTIVPLFVALNEGLELGFTNPLILAGFGISILAFICFLFVEKRSVNPLVDLSLFRNKLFSLSIFCGYISFIAIFCHNIILPFYLQDALGYSPIFAGLVLMVYPLVLTFVAPISGHLSDKMGSEKLTFIGLLLTSIGLLLMSTLGEKIHLIPMICFIVLMSLGNGLFQSPNNSLIISTVPWDKLGIAGSINALIRNVGMVCGIALSTTLLYSMMSIKIGHRVTDYVVGRNDAFIYGMHAVYIVAGVICAIGALLTFLRMAGSKKDSIR